MRKRIADEVIGGSPKRVRSDRELDDIVSHPEEIKDPKNLEESPKGFDDIMSQPDESGKEEDPKTLGKEGSPTGVSSDEISELDDMMSQPEESEEEEIKDPKTIATEHISNIIKIIAEPLLGNYSKEENKITSDSESKNIPSQEFDKCLFVKKFESSNKTVVVIVRNPKGSSTMQECEEISEAGSADSIRIKTTEKCIDKSEDESQSVTVPCDVNAIEKRLSEACFERLQQILKAGFSHMVKCNRRKLTVSDFRRGCKYYSFEHVGL